MSKLRVKVKAVNAANAHANHIYKVMAEYFAQYVGQEIFNQDGSLKAKIKKNLPALVNNHQLIAYLKQSDYSLLFEVRASENIDGVYMSQEASIYVGRLDNRVLIELSPAENFRCDWTIEEVQKHREDYKAKKRAAELAQTAMHPFTEYD